MKTLVRSSILPEVAPATKSAVNAFSPDDLAIVQKRQDWRLRVAHICIDYFEKCNRSALVSSRKSPSDVKELTERFERISDFVKRILSPLLATGVAVHELEAVRYQVNYFLEELVRHLRVSIQKRLRARHPLQDSTQEQIETEVRGALDEQTDSLFVFIEDLVKLAEFELEVNHQRERIRLLLGGDRRLSGLGNNETIMSAPLDQFWKAVDDFVAVYGYLRENLPPLLQQASPYRDLEDELTAAHNQFVLLMGERAEAFLGRQTLCRVDDRGMEDLEGRLKMSISRATEILETRIKPLLSRIKAPHRGAIRISELDNLAIWVRQLGDEADELPSGDELPKPRQSLGGRVKTVDMYRHLPHHLQAVSVSAQNLRRAVLLEQDSRSSLPEAPELEAMLVELDRSVLALRTGLGTVQGEIRTLRDAHIKPLREHFCALLGEFRTYLQTSFAHIASKDPRSTESSYHFFLREFSNEAQQAILLLNEIRALEYLVNRLQRVNIAGLVLTPENLARILRVLFLEKDEEKKRIPSGEGWRVMARFLEQLRDELVPRLQKVCSLDGIRFEDKNFLSEWALELTRNCTLCLTEHQIGYGLLQEMGRLRDDPESVTARQSYTNIVTAKTCKAMQQSLTDICMTLTASIPYVGIMRGGIERRASIFFHRQQKLLERGSGGDEEPGDDEEGGNGSHGTVFPGTVSHGTSVFDDAKDL